MTTFAGDRILPSDHNDVIDRPMCHIVQQTVQTGWTTNTLTPVTFGASSEVIDTGTFHDTGSNTSRIVIGKKLGWWAVSGSFCPAANGSATSMRGVLGKNGSAIQGSFAGGPPFNIFWGITTNTVLVEATAAADYVELFGLVISASGTLGTSVNSYVASSLTAIWQRAS